MKKIQLLKPHYRVEECLKKIKECLEVGWTGMGSKTVEFENRWKDYTKLNNAHFLNSATAGLHLAIKILKNEYGWQNNDEIITTSLTFVSTNHAIMYENLKPVFADIDESLNLDPIFLKSKITKKTKAIMFVGVAGNTANLVEIIKIAKKNDLRVILDAAHMAGSKIDGKHVGFDCDVSIFSYQAVKNLPTADSGMICFAEERLDKKAREMSWLGINKTTYDRSKKGDYKWNYKVDTIGYKYHGNSIMASLGLVGLKYLDKDNAYRRQLALWYIKYLNNKVTYIKHCSDLTSRHLFQILVEKREKVINYLAKKNIFLGVHYRDNMEYSVYKGNLLPNVQYYSKKLLSLPLHMELKEKDISNICSKLLEAIM